MAHEVLDRLDSAVMVRRYAEQCVALKISVADALVNGVAMTDAQAMAVRNYRHWLRKLRVQQEREAGR